MYFNSFECSYVYFIFNFTCCLNKSTKARKCFASSQLNVLRRATKTSQNRMEKNISARGALGNCAMVFQIVCMQLFSVKELNCKTATISLKYKIYFVISATAYIILASVLAQRYIELINEGAQNDMQLIFRCSACLVVLSTFTTSMFGFYKTITTSNEFRQFYENCLEIDEIFQDFKIKLPMESFKRKFYVRFAFYWIVLLISASLNVSKNKFKRESMASWVTQQSYYA